MNGWDVFWLSGAFLMVFLCYVAALRDFDRGRTVWAFFFAALASAQLASRVAYIIQLTQEVPK